MVAVGVGVIAMIWEITLLVVWDDVWRREWVIQDAVQRD